MTTGKTEAEVRRRFTAAPEVVFAAFAEPSLVVRGSTGPPAAGGVPHGSETPVLHFAKRIDVVAWPPRAVT